MGQTMTPVREQTPLPSSFWPYFDAIEPADVRGFSFGAGNITAAYRAHDTMFDHVLLVSEDDENVFLVVILDRTKDCVYGHFLLDLPLVYGLRP